MSKGAVIAFAAGLALAIPAGEALHRHLTNRSPTVTTCADYARARTSAVWLRVLNCEVDYLGVAYRESSGTVQELFFPVRPTGTPRTEPATLVAATSDPSVLAIAESGIGSGRQPNQEQFLVMMLRIVTTLGAARQIEGIARTGLLDRPRRRRVLAAFSTPLAPGAVIVDLNAQPSLLWPVLQTVAALGLMGTALGLFQRARRRRAAARVSGEAGWAEPFALASYPTEQAVTPIPNTTPIEPRDGASAPSASPMRLRGLLLLNLSPAEGVEHIEHAPPLGPRDETLRRIRRAIAGMQFDGRGRGMLRRGPYVVIVDVRLDDPVQAAIAGADGGWAVEALRRLLAETGWRAYVPRTGRFLDP